MLIENALTDAVRFFHIDALSSSVGMKVDFDMALLVLALGFYRLWPVAWVATRRPSTANLPRSYRHAGRHRRHRKRNHRAIPSPRPSSRRSRIRSLR
jgi:hypothetical protein